jgi:hypothetical protein
MLWKFLLFIFILGTGQIPALAHVNSFNNGIEVTMHIEPNDSPTKDQKAIFQVYFNDSANKFRGENCDCFYTLKSEQKEVKLPLQVLSKSTYDYSSFDTNFDKEGQYTITFSGNPKVQAAEDSKFKDFQVSFNFRVDQKVGENIKDSIWLYHLAYIIIILITFYIGWLGLEILRIRIN